MTALLDLETALGRSYDLVVIGAGPAGLTLAHTLIGAPLRVLVIDAGSAGRGKPARDGRDDLRGEIAPGTGHPLPDLYRLRGLGGTSRIWGGRSTPLDAIDFEKRPWIDTAGWPIDYASLAAHYPRAFDICEAGDGCIDPAVVFDKGYAAAVEGIDSSVLATTLERFSKPTNFWKRLGPMLCQANNVDIVVGAPVTRLLARADGAAIHGVEVVAPDGRRRRLRARTIVLAAGGLEIPRLLLNSHDVWSDGLGNAHGNVGRHYMAHVCMTLGTLSLAPGVVTRLDYARDPEGIYVRRRLWPTPETQRRHRLLNAVFRTYLPEPADPSHGDAVLSAMFLTKQFVQREYAARFVEKPVATRAYLRHLANITRGIPELSGFSAMWMRQRILAARKIPSVVRPAAAGRHQIEILCEQSPDRLSRVGLSSQRDRFGERRLLVDWRIGSADIEALARTCGVLAKTVAETGVGCYEAPIDDLAALGERVRRLGAYTGHHIGTARMAADPRRGVVDADCRVHGLANLYVASSAIFPTSGQANPTLSIVAFAMRLAEHLRCELTQRPCLEVAA